MTLLCESQHKSFNGTQGVYSHFSKLLNCQMEFSVFLPAHEDNEKLPVLYYLSGLTCTQDNVTTKGGFQRYASEHRIIIVCPDTSPRGSDYPGEHDDYDFGSGAGFYLNATQPPWSEKYLMYDYVQKELPNLIADKFPIDRLRAGIFGHSMGGHGALVLGLRNPGQFPSISAFAPIVAPSHCPWGQKALTNYLGSDKKSWQKYDATELVKEGYYSKFKILIDQGAQDQFLQDQLKPKLFLEACQENEQQLDFRLHHGYDHSYYFVSTFMADHIHFHAENLRSI